MSDHLEIEAKFLSGKELTRKDVGSTLEFLGLRVIWHDPDLHADTYFDESTRRLLKSGSSLRIRRSAERTIGTFKSGKTEEGPIMARREIEWELKKSAESQDGRSFFSSTPPDVRERLAELGIESVIPVLTIETLRHGADVYGPDGFQAEATIDECTVRGPRGEAKYSEIELEMKAGQIDFLRLVTEALTSKLKLIPSAKSKFDRGMELVG